MTYEFTNTIITTPHYSKIHVKVTRNNYGITTHNQYIWEEDPDNPNQICISLALLANIDEHYMYVSGGNIFIGDYEVSVVGWDSQLNGLICERQLS